MAGRQNGPPSGSFLKHSERHERCIRDARHISSGTGNGQRQRHKMATERTYIIPLRKQVNKSPRYKRAKKAVNTVKIFLAKHMKSDDIKIGTVLNELLWERGIKNPPSKIKVTVIKDDKGVAKAELFGHTYIEKKKAEKKEEKSKLEQLKEKLVGEKKEETKEQIENKEAITNVETHGHGSHAHTSSEHNRELKSVDEKDMKVSSGKQKAQNKGLR